MHRACPAPLCSSCLLPLAPRRLPRAACPSPAPRSSPHSGPLACVRAPRPLPAPALLASRRAPRPSFFTGERGVCRTIWAKSSCKSSDLLFGRRRMRVAGLLVRRAISGSARQRAISGQCATSGQRATDGYRQRRTIRAQHHLSGARVSLAARPSSFAVRRPCHGIARPSDTTPGAGAQPASSVSVWQPTQ